MALQRYKISLQVEKHFSREEEREILHLRVTMQYPPFILKFLMSKIDKIRISHLPYFFYWVGI